MIPQLVNDHHLLPVLHNFEQAVKWSVNWQTEVDAALRGYEARASHRQWPRPLLGIVPDLRGEIQWSDLRQRLVAGLRVDHLVPANTDASVGRFCVPWATRESWVKSATGTALTLQPLHYPWAAGDFLLYFEDDEMGWTLAEVESVAGTATAGQTLTLSEALAVVPGVDTCVFPIFYGRLAKTIEVNLSTPLHADLGLQLVGESYEIDEDAWPIEGGGGGGTPPPLPVAAFDVSIECLTVEVDASDSTFGAGTTAAGYFWEWGDGELGEGVNAEHTYLQAGTYIITLTIRDSLGRRAAAAEQVTVAPCVGDPEGPEVPGPEDPIPDPPDPDAPDAPSGPDDPEPDDQPDAPQPWLPAPEDYPVPTTSSGDPIAPPGFGA